MSATILELILDQATWNSPEFLQFMNVQIQPHILSHLMGANAELQFWADAFQYKMEQRPNIEYFNIRMKSFWHKSK